jgi:glutamyl-tRNA reductase
MAQLCYVGIRFQAASIEVREPLSIPAEEQTVHLQSLVNASPDIEGAVFLGTCNRSEFYLLLNDVEQGLEQWEHWIERTRGFQVEAHHSKISLLLQRDAARHLFQVASGLESLILGEGQILGQVKDALQVARQARTAPLLLERLFQQAIRVGKQVRSETGISCRDASVSKAAFKFAQEQDVRPFTEKRVVVIGGGKMAELLLEQLAKQIPAAQRAHQVTLVNRSPHRLEALCERFGFKGSQWDALPEALTDADVVFVATGAPHIVLSESTLRPIVEQFPKQRLLIDISVPRNIEPSIANLPKTALYNTDDLANSQEFSATRQEAIRAEAGAVVQAQLLAFDRDWAQAPLKKSWGGLRQQFEAIRRQELERWQTEGEQAPVEVVTYQLLQKLLHPPSEGIIPEGLETERIELEEAEIALRWLQRQFQK